MSTKPVLTVLIYQQPSGGISLSGVCEDVDIFRNGHFTSLNEALQYLNAHYHNRYKVVLNIPPNVKR
jgi:hypothetical protein